MSTVQIDIPVIRCDKFLQDARFEHARQSLMLPSEGHAFPKLMKQLSNPEQEDREPLSLENYLDRVYFHTGMFELIVDCRGLDSTDITCVAGERNIQIHAFTTEYAKQTGGPLTKRQKLMERSYDLPQVINPDVGDCLLSKEGILVVAFPWNKEIESTISE